MRPSPVHASIDPTELQYARFNISSPSRFLMHFVFSRNTCLKFQVQACLSVETDRLLGKHSDTQIRSHQWLYFWVSARKKSRPFSAKYRSLSNGDHFQQNVKLQQCVKDRFRLFQHGRRNGLEIVSKITTCEQWNEKRLWHESNGFASETANAGMRPIGFETKRAEKFKKV